MKTLILVRHAKSSWSQAGVSDHERALNARGKRDAPAMGRWLLGSGWLPDIWISSDARRAKDTAFAMMHAAEQTHLKLTLVPALYHASQEMLLQHIQDLSSGAERVLMVGHNPGLTYVNRSLGFKSLDNLPTCGLVIWQATHWSVLAAGKARYVTHQFPRMLHLKG